MTTAPYPDAHGVVFGDWCATCRAYVQWLLYREDHRTSQRCTICGTVDQGARS